MKVSAYQMEADNQDEICGSANSENDKNMDQDAKMDMLPDEMVQHILQYLPLPSLKVVVQVCQRWGRLGGRPALWAKAWVILNKENIDSLPEILNTGRLRAVRRMRIEHATARCLHLARHQPKLQELEVSCPALASVAPTSLASLVAGVQTAKLWRASVTPDQASAILTSLSAGCRLRHLDLSNTDLSGVRPGLLAGAVTQLDTLDLWRTGLGQDHVEALLTGIAKGGRLKSLNLCCNTLYSVAPEVLAKAARALETLRLGSTLLTGQQAELLLASISSDDSLLRSLDISNNNLSSVEPGLLAAAVAGLESLELWKTQLTPAQLKTVFEAASEGCRLQRLSIGHTPVWSVERGLVARVARRLTLRMECVPLSSRQIEAVVRILYGGTDSNQPDVESKFPLYSIISGDYMLKCYH